MKSTIAPSPNVANWGVSLALAKNEKVKTARPATPKTLPPEPRFALGAAGAESSSSIR